MTATMSTSSTPNLLGMPFEIRQLIYQALLLEDQHEICLTLDRKYESISHHFCWCGLAFCCRHLRSEVRAFVARLHIRISARHDSANLYANVSSLCGFRSFRPCCVRFDINPFLYRRMIPSLFTTLLSATRYLDRIIPGPLPRVEIRFEGILPRRTPPLCVDELDLERAPLHMMVLLFPFRLLRRAEAGNVSIIGGPLNDPWTEYCFLTDCGKQVCQEMEAEEPPGQQLVELAVKLELALQDGIIWDEPRLSQFVGLGLCPRRVLGSPPWSGSTLTGLNHRCDMCGNRFQSQSQVVRHLSLYHFTSGAIVG